MSSELGTPAREGKRPLDLPVLAVSGVVVVALCIWGVAAPEQLQAVSGDWLGWITTNLGWAFAVSASGFVALALVLAFSRAGRIRLGADDERPQFSRASWIAMMFSAGMGIGLMFYGVTEPVTSGRSSQERRKRASSSSGSRRSRVAETAALALERRSGGKTDGPRITDERLG